MTGVAITYPVDALVSFHYYAGDNDMGRLVNTGRLRLIGDSGAFSAMTQGATIQLDAYADWVTRWQPHLFWAAALDVIGDPVASHRNWRVLRDRHRLDTVPTLHAGADPKWLDAYAADGVDFLGLGGMAGTGQAAKAFRWAVHMFRYARDRWPGVRFHLWGVTNRKFLDALPAYSADSSGILGGAYRYARLRLFDPATGQHRQVMLQGGRAIYGLAPLLRRVYGVAPGDIARSHPGNRVTLIKLAAASTQQYAAWLQRRHRVTPPTWGINPAAPVGPLVHVVSAGAGGSTDDLEAAAAPAGTRVHVVAGANQPPDVLPALEDGPLIHVADTDHANMVPMTTQEGQ